MSRQDSTMQLPRRFFLVYIVLAWTALSTDAFRRKKQREAEITAQRAAEQRAQLVMFTVGGVDVPTTAVYACTATIIVAILTAVFWTRSSPGKSCPGNHPNEPDTLDVVLVGCGLPKKGMGWYHLTQLLQMKRVNVTAVVEPFFLNPQLCPKPPLSFTDLVASLQKQGVIVAASVDALQTFRRPTMCLIAGRTHDNPHLFQQCIHNGASTIYLEKPGAATVSQLQTMKRLADSHRAKVYIGYNKNVTPYVRDALACADQIPNSHVVFCHNNSYRPADLPECFERNSEGILKNMAIHELALLVSFFGVSVGTIQSFQVNPKRLYSEKLSIRKPGSSITHPEYITDFSRVAFQVTTNTGTKVSVMADRCGGNVSWALVKDGRGRDVRKFEFPDAEMLMDVERKSMADPEMMPYFFIQSDDYLQLKTRVVDSALHGTDAQGVATIQVGIEALKLAEYGTAELDQALEAKR